MVGFPARSDTLRLTTFYDKGGSRDDVGLKIASSEDVKSSLPLKCRSV